MTDTTSKNLVLPSDVLLIPVSDLAPDVRAKIDCEDSSFALTRPRARVPSKVVDPQAASLLEEFRTPKSIVQAIISFSKTHSTDPQETLGHAYPLIESLVRSSLLVPEGSEAAELIEPSLEAGTQVGAYETVECVHMLDDTELYQARAEDGTLVAIKLARRENDAAMRVLLKRESAILDHLQGEVTPKVLESGDHDGRAYLAIEWFSGAPVTGATTQLLLRTDDDARWRLRDMCIAITDAYSQVHARGVVHSDVHPGNVLVDADDVVKIIDFGLARVRTSRGKLRSAPRGGIAYFFEPEYAKAVLAGKRAPASSEKGEQYAVAAMLFHLLTGAHYLDFHLESDEMLRQIAEEQPRSFESAGREAWPEVEEILGKALRKDPARRHRSLDAMADRLRAIARRGREDRGDSGGADGSIPSASQSLLDRVLARICPAGRSSSPASRSRLTRRSTLAPVGLPMPSIEWRAYGMIRSF